MDIDSLVNADPFILNLNISQDVQSNINRWADLIECNATELAHMISKTPRILTFDCRRSATVKRRLISEYFHSFQSQSMHNGNVPSNSINFEETDNMNKIWNEIQNKLTPKKRE